MISWKWATPELNCRSVFYWILVFMDVTLIVCTRIMMDYLMFGYYLHGQWEIEYAFLKSSQTQRTRSCSHTRSEYSTKAVIGTFSFADVDPRKVIYICGTIPPWQHSSFWLGFSLRVKKCKESSELLWENCRIGQHGLCKVLTTPPSWVSFQRHLIHMFL